MDAQEAIQYTAVPMIESGTCSNAGLSYRLEFVDPREVSSQGTHNLEHAAFGTWTGVIQGERGKHIKELRWLG